jgi:hypothetical protein
MKSINLDRLNRRQTREKMLALLQEVRQRNRRRWWHKLHDFFFPPAVIKCDFCEASSDKALVYEPFRIVSDDGWNQLGFRTVCVKCARGSDPKKPGLFENLMPTKKKEAA